MITLIIGTPRFKLGQIVTTANALTTVSPRAISEGLQRHARGDWGNVCKSDADLNDEALIHGDRLLSVYGEGKKCFWIITESDRSVTTILLPEDY